MNSQRSACVTTIRFGTVRRCFWLKHRWVDKENNKPICCWCFNFTEQNACIRLWRHFLATEHNARSSGRLRVVFERWWRRGLHQQTATPRTSYEGETQSSSLVLKVKFNQFYFADSRPEVGKVHVRSDERSSLHDESGSCNLEENVASTTIAQLLQQRLISPTKATGLN